MPPFRAPSALRSTFSRAGLALLVLAATVFLPYLFPAPLAISHSWVAGFNNRIAVLLFAGGALLFAIYTSGRLAVSTEEADTPLPWSSLALALGVTLVACVALCWPAFRVLPGYESNYFLNRLQMLDAGLRPYRDFEFAYGPLLLYPIRWTQRLFHLPAVTAFDVVWTLYWQAGIALLWFIVRSIDLIVPHRLRLFFLLFGVQLSIIIIAAPSYSAVRTYSAAGVVVAAHRVWRRTQTLWPTAFVCLLAVPIALACSFEQGVSAMAGCATLLFLLAWRRPRHLWLAVLVVLAGWGFCWKAAADLGMLGTARAFSAGGYTEPVLPSPTILTTLFTYLAAVCAAYAAARAFFARPREHSAPLPLSVPLTVAGLALLPGAMGRTDLLHIPSATPALVVGAAAIAALPAVRRWWTPAFLLAVVLAPPALYWTAYHVYLGPKTNHDPALQAQGFMHPVSDSQWYLSIPRIAVAELPCDRTYFSPAFIPDPEKPFDPRCLDTGYYLGFTNLSTADGIASVVRELQRHASQPLLLQTSPLEAQLPLQFVDMDMLRYSELSPWVPASRHPPLTYAPILDEIRSHWRPGPKILGGRLQIWEPTSPGPSRGSRPF